MKRSIVLALCLVCYGTLAKGLAYGQAHSEAQDVTRRLSEKLTRMLNNGDLRGFLALFQPEVRVTFDTAGSQTDLAGIRERFHLLRPSQRANGVRLAMFRSVGAAGMVEWHINDARTTWPQLAFFEVHAGTIQSISFYADRIAATRAYGGVSLDQCFTRWRTQLGMKPTKNDTVPGQRELTREEATKIRPFPPSGLIATVTGSAIRLQWRAQRGDITGYALYRKGPGQPYRRLATIQAQQELEAAPEAHYEYRDAQVRPGVQYRYAVSANGSLGIESNLSDFAVAEAK